MVSRMVHLTDYFNTQLLQIATLYGFIGHYNCVILD